MQRKKKAGNPKYTMHLWYSTMCRLYSNILLELCKEV